ncbi:MAG: LON peptidase substrate-binding domain-containing protein [Candidatus Sumerlaeia bacterium]
MLNQTIHYLPIFPLPRVVLFPRTRIPLHIFEPRYRKMVADCLNKDRRLGIVQLRHGNRRDAAEDNPPVFRVLTIGRIVFERKLEDGKYDILVEGHERARIISEVIHQPYRIAKQISLQEFIEPNSPRELQRAASDMLQLVRELGEKYPRARRSLKSILSAYTHPGIIADLIAYQFVSQPYDQQCILEELNVIRRVQLVSVQLHMLLAQLANLPQIENNAE